MQIDPNQKAAAQPAPEAPNNVDQELANKVNNLALNQGFRLHRPNNQHPGRAAILLARLNKA